MTRERSEEHATGTVCPGAVLAGRYRLAQRLGRGGFADVFRGADEVLGRPVAVKVFRPSAGESDERRVEAIDAEVRTLAGLDHPGLVTVFDAGVTDAGADHVPYLVMELVNGPTLAQRLSSGPLGPALTAAVGLQLADALGYVHRQGVVHRDVKPANVLLNVLDLSGGRSAPSVKLTDFGIARIIGSPRLTVEDGAVGTPNYLSPEQVEGAPAGPASDIYSLGLVLLECLSGKLAYPGSGFEAALARLRRAPVVPDDLGPRWAGFLRAMTDRDPGARPDAAQVSAGLAELAQLPRPAGDLTWPHRPARPQVAGSTMLLPAPPRRRRLVRRRLVWRGLWIGVAAALVGGIAATAAVLSRMHDAPAPVPVPTSYPSVGGQLGADLSKLEQVIP